MPSNATDVQVQLVTEISDENRKEQMTIEEPGQFFQRGDTQVLTFTEHPDEGEPVDTMITVKPNHVSIKRSGGVDMRQVFNPQIETENTYRHTYGVFHMKTKTDHIEFEPLEGSKLGRLFIKYQMTLNHEVIQAHRLIVTFEEERKA
ncbi:DUF1934 domain-containing protein [Halobacillus salinarum]|uniref:DUF1934 domain-containing protein n=1 Tax=Halobacillus salinarum TaxID=2932257 RepID=A0ABY4ELG9_9BACI|nr:DUF1934 domain-containing protein [Halobacillus salinarum]UOQ45309.1 DUF1934 domain-containing protein [Halobacillus salinarum]